MPIKLLSHSYIFPIRLALEIIWEPQLNLRIVRWLFALFETAIIIYSLCFSELFPLVRKLGIPLNKNLLEMFFFLLITLTMKILATDHYAFIKKIIIFLFASNSWCIGLRSAAWVGCYMPNFWDALYQKRLKSLMKKTWKNVLGTSEVTEVEVTVLRFKFTIYKWKPNYLAKLFFG